MPCSTDHTQTLAIAAVHILYMAEILSYRVIKREGVLESSSFFLLATQHQFFSNLWVRLRLFYNVTYARAALSASTAVLC